MTGIRTSAALVAVAVIALPGCGGRSADEVEAKLLANQDSFGAQERQVYEKAGARAIAVIAPQVRADATYTTARVLRETFDGAVAHIPPRFRRDAARRMYNLAAELANDRRLPNAEATELVEGLGRQFDLGLAGQHPDQAPPATPSHPRARCRAEGDGFACLLDELAAGQRTAPLKVRVTGDKAMTYKVEGVSTELAGKYRLKTNRPYTRPY